MFQHPEIELNMAETIFHKTKVGLSFVSKEGMFIRCNQALCEILGYSESELKRKNFADLTHPEDLQADLEMVQRVIRGEIEEYPMTKRYITKNGGVIWVKLVVTAIKDVDNAVAILFSQVLPIDPSNPQELSKIIDTKFKEFGILLSDSTKEDEDEESNKKTLTTTLLGFLGQEWKWIIAFLATFIGGAIAWETNRRINEFKTEERFVTIEKNMHSIEQNTEKGFEEIKELFKDYIESK